VRGIAGSFLTGIIIISILFVLVRPNSKGPQLVTAVSGGLQGLIGKATGGGGFTASGKA
jgi:hypothetical protein